MLRGTAETPVGRCGARSIKLVEVVLPERGAAAPRLQAGGGTQPDKVRLKPPAQRVDAVSLPAVVRQVKQYIALASSDSR